MIRDSAMRVALVAVVGCFIGSGLSSQTPGFVLETRDAGNRTSKAQPGTGSGALHSVVCNLHSQIDIDAFLIRINVPNNFIADTDVPTTTVNDTTLYLLDGHGCALSFNDDISGTNLRSRLDGTHVPAPGVYCLIATSRGNHPVNSNGQLIFNQQSNWTSVNPPNGPGASNPTVTGWNKQGTESGIVGIMVNGAGYLTNGDPATYIEGLGCGGLEACPDSLAVLGHSMDVTLAGVGAAGVSALLARPGMTSFGTPLGWPVQTGCLNYLGNMPGVVLGLTTQQSQQFSVNIPNQPGFSGIPLGFQGARFNPNTNLITTSNGVEAFIGDLN